MILIIESEPQFIATKDIIVYTSQGEVVLEKGSPVGLLKTEDGKLNLGKSGDVLEFSNKTVIHDLLENCRPANFELIRDSEGDSIINPVLLEETLLVEDKLSRIVLRESIPHKLLTVQKIRAF